MKMRIAVCMLLSLVWAGPLVAARGGDVMPPPQKAPRIAVESQRLKEANEPKEFEGKARAIDGERLMIGEKEIRLFGVVTPSLNSNYGPQARAKLDELLQGKDVLCKVTDRDKEGRPVAFCGTVNTPDISYEMLRQGWAMLDRKALKNNSLIEVYGKVEQEAQAQNKGLFTPMPMAVSIPLSNPSKAVMVPDTAAQGDGLVKDKAAVSSSSPAPNAQPVSEQATPKPGAKAPDALVAAEVQKNLAREQNASRNVSNRTFVERYQQILSTVLGLLTLAGFGGVLLVRDRLRLRDKRRMLAAALHGELSALRQVCRTRARELARQKRLIDADNQPRPAQLWPRLRQAVFQTQAGELGLLGSDLARQVAVIYGLCADYSVYAQHAAPSRLPSPQAVSESLSSLADKMEHALEALAQVENSGEVYVAEPVLEEDFSADMPQEALQPASVVDTVNTSGRMEKAAEAMAGLFRNRRERTEAVKAEATEVGSGEKPPEQNKAEAEKPEQQAA